MRHDAEEFYAPCESCGCEVMLEPYDDAETFWTLDARGREIGYMLCPDCYAEWQDERDDELVDLDDPDLDWYD